MSTLPEDLAKMEYERLSKEIVSIQKEANQLARYAIIASAAICAVIVTKSDLPRQYFHILKLFPFSIVLLFGFRVLALFKRLQAISFYIENHFEHDILKKEFASLGWESHLNNSMRKLKSYVKYPRGSVGLFWLILLGLSFIFILI